jgi:hypothetical protein
MKHVYGFGSNAPGHAGQGVLIPEVLWPLDRQRTITGSLGFGSHGTKCDYRT